MNKTKKFLAVVLTATLLMSLLPLGAYSVEPEPAKVNQTALELLTALGAFDGIGAIADYSAPITPEVFRSVLHNLIGFDSGSTSDWLVSPELINCSEAVREFVLLLGYKVKAEMAGGYPVGYMSQALELKLLRNLSLEAGQAVTYADLVQMLYNVLEVDVLKEVSTGERTEYRATRGENFLTELMKLKKVEGRVTANRVTSLDDPVGVGKNNVEIDGVVYETGLGAQNAQQMIGREVIGYYEYQKDAGSNQSKVLVTVFPSTRYDSLVVQAEDVVGFSSNTFSYFSPETGKVVSEAVVPNPSVIYNGVLVTSYDDSLFDFEQGQVELIESKNGYDVILITDYIDIVVGGVDALNFAVYDKLAGSEQWLDENTLVFDESDSTQVIEMTDTAGKEVKFADIALDDVLSIARNGNYSRVIVSRKQVKNFQVTLIDRQGPDTIFSDGTNEYRVSPYLLSSRHYTELKVGDNVSFVVNAFDKITWQLTSTASGMSEGYFVKAFLQQGLSGVLEVKIFSSLGKMLYLEGAERIRFAGSDGQPPVYLNSRQVFERIGTFTGVVRFTVDEEGKLNRIELPLNQYQSHLKERSHKIDYEQIKKEYTAEFEEKYQVGLVLDNKYRTGPRTIGGRLYLKSNVIIYAIPPDLDDDDNYEIRALSSIEDRYEFGAFEGYSTDETSTLLDSLVFKGQTKKLVSKVNAAVVQSVSSVIDSFGTEYKRVIGFESGTKVVLDSPIQANGSAFDNAQDLTNLISSSHVVEPGDIIRYTKGVVSGQVDSVQLLFDANGTNPAFPQGATGVIPGTSGQHQKGASNNVPFGVTMEFTPNTSNPHTFNGSYYRVMLGWVYNKNGNFCTVTTQDLSSTKYNPDLQWNSSRAGTFQETYNFGLFFTQWPTSKITTVELGGPEVVAREAKINDVRSYQEAGAACSRILAMVFWGEPVQMFVINGSLPRN